jgi:hypothetical protein
MMRREGNERVKVAYHTDCEVLVFCVCVIGWNEPIRRENLFVAVVSR